MRILLLNDNPVVRKLVALSAQKTKDDLSVVWSVDEIEHDVYDLVIIDDAYYSDEIMVELSEKITYKTNLLMATRGNAIPAGFDKVINKPFLPTDLVELFANIEKSLPSTPSVAEPLAKEDEKVINVPTIELDTLLDDMEESVSSLSALEDDVDFSEDDELFGLDDIEDELPMETKTSILDHEEVQELQGLLEDTDTFDEDEEFSIEGLDLDDEPVESADASSMESMDDLSLDTLESAELDEMLLEGFELEESTDDEVLDTALLDELMMDGLDESIEELKPEREVFDSGSLDDLMMDELDESIEEPKPEDDLLESASLDDLMMDELEPQELESLDDLMLNEDEEIRESLPLIEEDVPELLSDDEFDDLEQQIQDAVGELDFDDLESTLEDTDLEEFGLGDLDSFDGMDGLDELDGIDEREMKLAVGESVEEELSIRVGSGEHSSLDAEALSEAMGKSAKMEIDEHDTVDAPVAVTEKETKSSSSEGMEALQALLKVLSNDDVAASLKGLNISININFGNDK